MADVYFIRLPVVLFCSIIFLTGSAFADRKDLRGVHWGMSRFDVMASEDLSPESFDVCHIHYKTELEGMKQDLIYGFTDNMLVDAVYVVTVLSENEYAVFRKRLERRYGKPVSSENRSDGVYYYVWENNSTRIVMRPGRLRECRIEYISKKYSYLKESISLEVKTGRERELDWSY